MEIGERLFSLRQKAGESLQDVAKGIGVSKAHVWDLEKGHSSNPSFDLVQKIATHFGVSIDVLTGADAEPEAEDMQIERIHRGLSDLSDRDREIVEQMVASMARKTDGDA